MHKLLYSGKLMALILAAVAGLVLYDALQSPRYRVRVVEAVGTQALTSDDVAALAQVNDQSIWYVQPRDIEARVRQSPYVEQAKARLVLPDRLLVTVTERKPDVRWVHDGIAFAVTWDGLVLDQAGAKSAAPQMATEQGSGTATPPNTAVPPEASPAAGDPPPPSTEPAAASAVTPATAESSPAATAAPPGFISVVTIVDTTPNRPLKVGDHVDADALELARRVTLRAPSELPVPIQRIEWDGGLGVSLIVGDGRQVVLGKSDDLDRKMATLRFILSDNTAFKYLDLRPSTPYYR